VIRNRVSIPENFQNSAVDRFLFLPGSKISRSVMIPQQDSASELSTNSADMEGARDIPWVGKSAR